MNPVVDARVQQARLAVGDQAFFARVCAADSAEEAVDQILQEQLRARLDRLEALIASAADPQPPAPLPEALEPLLTWNVRAEAAEAKWREQRAEREARRAEREAQLRAPRTPTWRQVEAARRREAKEAEWKARWDAREAAREARRKRDAWKRAKAAREAREALQRISRPFVKQSIPLAAEDAWMHTCTYTFTDYAGAEAPVVERDDSDAFYVEALGWTLVGLDRKQAFCEDRRTRRRGPRLQVDAALESKWKLNNGPYEDIWDPLMPWTPEIECVQGRRRW